jgi:phage terminase small subunit
VAQLAEPVDEVFARRLFGMIDARDKLWRIAIEEPLTAGSKRQKRANPTFAMALALDDRIERLGKSFGITPAARAALGISFAEARRSLEDLARDSAEGVERAASE